MRGHTHDLDGKLHDGCFECEYAVSRGVTAKREKDTDALAKRFSDIAERPGKEPDD